jgi:hypothetical protein
MGQRREEAHQQTPPNETTSSGERHEGRCPGGRKKRNKCPYTAEERQVPSETSTRPKETTLVPKPYRVKRPIETNESTPIDEPYTTN